MATDIYINRVNGAPCGDTTIQLFKGADSSENQEVRKDLQVFLKGTKAQKRILQHEKPDRWTSFERVWEIRRRHIVPNLPPQYVYFLKCCLQSNCSHPLCQEGIQLPPWFPGGPSLDYFPLPTIDPASTWGSTNCNKCQSKTGTCSGHFLSPDHELFLQGSIPPMIKPPSQLLKEAFEQLGGRDPSEDFVEGIAKATLLPSNEVLIWIDHLKTIQTNLKRGAEKAAATRRMKKNRNLPPVHCVCGEEYAEHTDEVQHWIGCDICDNWFHCHCVDIDPHSIPESFVCVKCS